MNSSRTQQRIPLTLAAARFHAASALALSLALLTACGRSESPAKVAPALQPEPNEAPLGEPLFVDATSDSGLDFVHFNAVAGDLLMPEMMGSGVGLIDFDNDGWLDLYLVQGAMLGQGKTLADALIQVQHPAPLSDRLYRNASEIAADGSRRLRFVDVTERSGIGSGDDGQAVTGNYGMGVAVGDFDADGFADLYLANLGRNQLLRNRGDGSFQDITERAGVSDPRWSISASFHDFDRDGRLDIYVANYIDFSVSETKRCFSPAGQEDYCGPTAYPPLVNSLFRNLGNGRFEDVSESSGIRSVAGHSLGVIVLDSNGDHLPDIYVANDGSANELWINDGSMKFHDEAALAGVAVNAEGQPEAGMGIDVADCNADGREDIILGHLSNEHNTLYLQGEQGGYRDETLLRGMSMATWIYTAFGISFLDYDLDGWLDIASVNGYVTFLDEREKEGRFPLGQANQLMRNQGDCRFSDVSAQSPDLMLSETSRGLAVGDLDNDGAPDLAISNAGGPARVLLNRAAKGRHWLGLRLLEANGADALGARVELRTADARTLWRRVRNDGSYASAPDPRVLFGLSDWRGPVDLKVHWPDGSVEQWQGLAPDQYHRLQHGEGKH